MHSFTSQKVCVKQLYERVPRATNKRNTERFSGPNELAKILTECNCLNWATILLSLTYSFVAREVDRRGLPTFRIPQLQYIKAVVAVSQELNRSYLIEQWIDTSNSPGFVKYINNRQAESVVSPNSPQTAHEIAAFLCFAQHVQWEKTGKLAFTSDYQGNVPHSCWQRAHILKYTIIQGLECY